MRRSIAVLAILSASVMPALADDSRLLTSIQLAEIEEVLTSEGHTIMDTGEEGAVSVRARTGNGLIFSVIGTACDTDLADGCLGLNMQVRYDADGKETLERINNANLMWSAASVWYTQTGFDGKTPTVGISRYVILDNGVTLGNIKENLFNLLAIAPKAADYIWEAGEYAPAATEDDEDDFYDDW